MRKALDLAFDFEWSNKKLFYELYKRTQSFFENSDMKASGKPVAGRSWRCSSRSRTSFRRKCSTSPTRRR